MAAVLKEAVAEVVPMVAKNAAKQAQPGAKRSRKAVKLPQLRASEKRGIGQFIAALAASFLPIASYVLSHFEAKQTPMMWMLVAAALMFSAPTLADWAMKWTRSRYKSWGFTVLLEGVMVASSTTYLGYAGLLILVVINAHSAWSLAGKNLKPKR